MLTTKKSVGEWCSSMESGPGKGVEVKFAVDGRVPVRDARTGGQDPGPPFLELLPQAWEEFLRGVRRGEFDQPPLSIFDVAAVR